MICLFPEPPISLVLPHLWFEDTLSFGLIKTWQASAVTFRLIYTFLDIMEEYMVLADRREGRCASRSVFGSCIGSFLSARSGVVTHPSVKLKCCPEEKKKKV